MTSFTELKPDDVINVKSIGVEGDLMPDLPPGPIEVQELQGIIPEALFAGLGIDKYGQGTLSGIYLDWYFCPEDMDCALEDQEGEPAGTPVKEEFTEKILYSPESGLTDLGKEVLGRED